MTTIELNQILMQEITSISSNENLVRKVINYVRKLQKQETETEFISKEEILAGIDAGLKEVKMLKDGKLKATSARDFLKELRYE